MQYHVCQLPEQWILLCQIELIDIVFLNIGSAVAIQRQDIYRHNGREIGVIARALKLMFNGQVYI